MLYINDEICLSFEQLKGYFRTPIAVGSTVFYDILDRGRYGDIARWLRLIGETETADRIEIVDIEQPDSEYINELGKAICGQYNYAPCCRPPFITCFEVENTTIDKNGNNAIVTLTLRVLMSVNETYSIVAKSGCGTVNKQINPCRLSVRERVSVLFEFHNDSNLELTNVELFADGSILSCLNCHASTEINVNGVSFNMVYIEGGKFMMGDRPVALSSFYCGETPVTQELWLAVMGNNPSCYTRHNSALKPVENVSWYDCSEFLERLNLITDIDKQFRLLTEAEWEFSARGGKQTSGFRYSGSNRLGEVGWNGSRVRRTRVVKQKKANELGLYDMSGNVEEWCSDLYEIQQLPGCPTKSMYVCRGGSIHSIPEQCSVAYRSGDSPTAHIGTRGFRLAMDITRTHAQTSQEPKCVGGTTSISSWINLLK